MKIDFLKEYSELLDDFAKGKGVLFIGAGLSMGIGLPSWEDLLKPQCERLGINSKDCSPIQIAQYYVNEATSGYKKLLQHVINEIKKVPYKFSLSHDYLRNIPAKAIITTNYDTFIEDSLNNDPKISFHKVVNDNDIPYKQEDELLLIKMNGCISQPDSIIITRDHFWKYRTNHPLICDIIKSFLINSTFLFIGFSFRDPVFEILYSEILRHLGAHKNPYYFLAINSNKHEIIDKKGIGIEVINLESDKENAAEDVSIFLKALHTGISNKLKSIKKAKNDFHHPSDDRFLSFKSNEATLMKEMIKTRLGSGLSLQIDHRYIDYNHFYDLVYREDFLDYETGDFFSIRRLSGYNTSDYHSPCLIYSESSEQKATFAQCNVKAFSYKTGEELIVEPFVDPNKMIFTHAFKIYFQHPLAKNKKFDIGYCIKLPGELAVLSNVDEVMSISLARITKGVNKLAFNVCLNFKPKSFSVECRDRKGNVIKKKLKEPRLIKFRPITKLEKRFQINWSSEPYKIEWSCQDPTETLYVINYKN